MTSSSNDMSFASLFEESLKTFDLKPGTIFDGLVLAIDKVRGTVTIDTPLKSEGIISLEEFMSPKGVIEVEVGDRVPVALEMIEDGSGATRLSRQKAKRLEAWKNLESAYEEQRSIMGMVYGKVKGGFTVDVNGIRAFLPGSLVDVRSARGDIQLEGKECEFKVIKLDQKRNNVVVSRRLAVESDTMADRCAALEGLEEGQVVTGTVKNLTDYGAFVDLGGVDGLLHITDIAWKRVKHPSELLEVGQSLEVKVLRFDKERMRVSLGLKQLDEDPWVGVARRYPEGTRVFGTVSNIADYGCFIELENGIEGLVHVSEIDWTNRNVHPSKIVMIGEEVEVMVLDIDEERRRISLGLKQCQPNPWEAFAKTHEKNDKITGKIKSITDFGIFIGLEGGIDGLVHLSDISWSVPGEEAVRQYKKGDEIAAIVLAVDADRERISLGIRQLEGDEYSEYLSAHPKGSVVSGKITDVDAKRVVVELAPGVEGHIRIVDLVVETVKVGETIEAKFFNVDKKSRILNLSVKAKEMQEESDALKEYKVNSDKQAGGGTLGDLFKEEMEK